MVRKFFGRIVPVEWSREVLINTLCRIYNRSGIIVQLIRELKTRMIR